MCSPGEATWGDLAPPFANATCNIAFAASRIIWLIVGAINALFVCFVLFVLFSRRRLILIEPRASVRSLFVLFQTFFFTACALTMGSNYLDVGSGPPYYGVGVDYITSTLFILGFSQVWLNYGVANRSRIMNQIKLVNLTRGVLPISPTVLYWALSLSLILNLFPYILIYAMVATQSGDVLRAWYFGTSFAGHFAVLFIIRPSTVIPTARALKRTLGSIHNSDHRLIIEKVIYNLEIWKWKAQVALSPILIVELCLTISPLYARVASSLLLPVEAFVVSTILLIEPYRLYKHKPSKGAVITSPNLGAAAASPEEGEDKFDSPEFGHTSDQDTELDQWHELGLSLGLKPKYHKPSIKNLEKKQLSVIMSSIGGLGEEEPSEN